MQSHHNPSIEEPILGYPIPPMPKSTWLTEKPSPFATFLQKPKVAKKLLANLEDIKKNIEDDKDGQYSSYISRCFQDLPKHYQGIQPLLGTLVEALLNDGIEAWVSLAIGYGLHDLFDSNADLRADVRNTINQNQILDKLIQKVGIEAVKVKLLSSYIGQIICEHASKVLMKIPTVLDDPEQKLFRHFFAAIQNKFNNQVTKVNGKLLLTNTKELIDEAIDPYSKFPQLKEYIRQLRHTQKIKNYLCDGHVATQTNLHAKNIIDEINRLAVNNHSSLLMAKLNEILRLTYKLMNSTDSDSEIDSIKKLRRIAGEITSRSWTQFFIGAGLGVFGIAATTSTLVLDRFQDTETRQKNITTGLGAAAAGGILLFKPSDKKHLADEIYSFIDCVEKSVCDSEIKFIPIN